MKQVFRVRKDGEPYWIVAKDGRLEGYSIEWHVNDSSFAGTYIGTYDPDHEIVELHAEGDEIHYTERNCHGCEYEETTSF